MAPLEGSTPKDRRQVLIAGAILVAIAVVIGGVVVARNGDDGGASCTLGASGVGLVANGLIKNRSAGVIVAEVAGSYALSTACKSAINTLVEDPDDSVKFDIETPSGETIEKETTGFELGELAPPAPPPPPEPSDVAEELRRLIDCQGWQSEVLYDLCVDGALPPPNG